MSSYVIDGNVMAYGPTHQFQAQDILIGTNVRIRGRCTCATWDGEPRDHVRYAWIDWLDHIAHRKVPG